MRATVQAAAKLTAIRPSVVLIAQTAPTLHIVDAIAGAVGQKGRMEATVRLAAVRPRPADLAQAGALETDASLRAERVQAVG